MPSRRKENTTLLFKKFLVVFQPQNNSNTPLVEQVRFITLARENAHPGEERGVSVGVFENLILALGLYWVILRKV